MDREAYSNFKEMLKDAISDELRGAEIVESSVLKRNSQMVDTFTINDRKSICPVIYPESLFEKYQRGVSIESIASGVVESIQENRFEEFPDLTREEAEKHVSISLLNTELNQEMLETCPNRQLNGTDLSEVVRWHLNDEASFLVKNDMMTNLKMTKEELFTVAENNLNNESFSIESIQDTMKELFYGDSVPDDIAAEMMPDVGPDLLVVSRKSLVDGSAALVSDKVMQAVHDRLGEDFYILPSSRHEVLCLGASAVDDPRELKRMVCEINASCLKPDDYLSDSTFRYNGRAHLLTMCNPEGTFLETDARSFEHSPRMVLGGM